MPIQIIREDITRIKADAIVNAANPQLLPGGGVCGAIHQAAGPGLAAECAGLGGCRPGEAKITGAYALPAKYVIHTVGPVWRGGNAGEPETLAACYRNCLMLAAARGCGSIAFPLISAGIYGYPAEKALRTAMHALSGWLLEAEAELTVILAVFAKESFAAGQKLFAGVEQYIDDHYAAARKDCRRRAEAEELPDFAPLPMEPMASMAPVCAQERKAQRPAPRFGRKRETDKAASLADALEQLDESFSQMVLRKIGEKGMKNAECYKKANLDKKLFSKIKGDVHYRPKKPTALALAVALELSLPETRELLGKAGFSLSRSDKFDVIVEYFLARGNYDVFEINEALFYYDQPLLGGAVL